MKLDKRTASTVRKINSFRCSGGNKIKARLKFEGDTVKLGRVCFDCYNGNNTNNYYQGMRKVSKYFDGISTYGTEIQSTIRKGAVKILKIMVKVTTGNNEVDKMLIGKELPEWVHRTIKLSEKMVHEYKVLLGKCMNFTRLKLEILKGLEETSNKSDLFSLMKGINGLIFKHENAEYFYTGMQLELRVFLDLNQGGITVMEYHVRWTTGKYLA